MLLNKSKHFFVNSFRDKRLAKTFFVKSPVRNIGTSQIAGKNSKIAK